MELWGPILIPNQILWYLAKKKVFLKLKLRTKLRDCNRSLTPSENCSELRLRTDARRSKESPNRRGVRKGGRAPARSFNSIEIVEKAIVYFPEGRGVKTKPLETLAMVSWKPDRSPQRCPAPRLCWRVRCQERCAHRHAARGPLGAPKPSLTHDFIPLSCTHFSRYKTRLKKGKERFQFDHTKEKEWAVTYLSIVAESKQVEKPAKRWSINEVTTEWEEKKDCEDGRRGSTHR